MGKIDFLYKKGFSGNLWVTSTRHGEPISFHALWNQLCRGLGGTEQIELL